MAEVKKFFQRPIVDAVQWTGDNFEKITTWLMDSQHDVRAAGRPVCSIYTEGNSLVFWVGEQRWSAAPGCWLTLSPYGWSVWGEHAFASAHDPVDLERDM